MHSPLHQARLKFQPKLPTALQNLGRQHFVPHRSDRKIEVRDSEGLRPLFPKTYGREIVKLQEGNKTFIPKKVGVVLSGGQAPGGHNVITGLFDALKTLHHQSELFGFLKGPGGIVDGKYRSLEKAEIDHYRNQGGFDLIGSGRTKIETDDQLEAAYRTLETLQLDGLVVIGGDDSNTNAAILAEFLLKKGSKTSVVGVPKTIDGDLKNPYVATSFGFDTACKVYAEMIGNLARDALSARKYTHFVKLMGRSASHITLECALSTQINYALIGEEIAAKQQSLDAIVADLCNLIAERSSKGKDYGVILVPEGLIEFIPSMRKLIQELNKTTDPNTLSAEAKQIFTSLPEDIQKQLMLDRDPHGNVQLSLIETEKLLIAKIEEELKKRQFKGKFSPLAHFLGYEGRCSFPSNFDANYCYALGMTAALLVEQKLTGYMAAIDKLHLPPSLWEIFGLPITLFMHKEERKGKLKPVIEKALVDLQGKAFRFFERARDNWKLEDAYRYPGPIQFFGPEELTDMIPITMQIEA